MSTVLEAALPEARRAAPPPPPAKTPSLLDRYRIGYQRRVTAHVDQRLRALRELRALQGLEAEQRTQVLVGMRRLQCQLAGVVVRKRDAMTALLRVTVVLLALYYALCIPFFVRRLMPGQVAKEPYVLGIAALLAGAGTLTLLARRARRRWGREAGRGQRGLRWTLAAVFYLGYFFAAIAVNPQDFTAGALRSLGIMLGYGLGLVILGAAALWWGMHITERWWDRHASARHPDAVVADELLRILETVEKSPAEWVHMRGRNRVLRSLERAARCLQHNLPYRLRGQDVETDRWLREKGAGQAAALRALKRWVLVPRSDTRERFIERISQDLVRTTVGDWDGLECAEPAAARMSRTRRAAKLLVPIAVIGLFVVLAQVPGDQIPFLGKLAPLAPTSLAVLAPMLIWAVVRVVNPEMIGDLPVIQQIQGMLPKREKD
ncbi:MAG TPA: hypothetical protein VGX50_01395 [Longimicrobium sp.]|jgi:hypothetical protein|nr:hypothetical protein [Longimicrobium sp.]